MSDLAAGVEAARLALDLVELIEKSGRDPLVEIPKIAGRYRDVQPEAESRWNAVKKKRFGDG